jgi:hypothetical protein
MTLACSIGDHYFATGEVQRKAIDLILGDHPESHFASRELQQKALDLLLGGAEAATKPVAPNILKMLSPSQAFLGTKKTSSPGK